MEYAHAYRMQKVIFNRDKKCVLYRLVSCIMMESRV